MLDSIGLDSVKAKLLPAFFGFIFIIISSRILGPTKVGEFIIYLVIYNILKLLCEGGFSLILSDKKYTTTHLYSTNLHYVTICIIGCVIIGLVNTIEYDLNTFFIQLSLISFCVQTYYQNDLKMKLEYNKLKKSTFYSSLIALSISIILIITTKNETILYARFLLFEFVLLVFLIRSSTVKYKFGSLKNLLKLYAKSIHFLFHGLIESLIEFFIVSSINISVGIGAVGFYNRSNQFVDAGVKMPIQGFRAAYIGLITSRNKNLNKEILFVFSFIILSTLILVSLAFYGDKIIIYTLGKEWIRILDWLKYAVLVGWGFSFEQLSSANLYLIKKQKFIVLFSLIIKIPIIILLINGFDLNAWIIWGKAYFILGLIYFILTSLKTIYEYRNSNNMDV